jgi:hypothetical protein
MERLTHSCYSFFARYLPTEGRQPDTVIGLAFTSVGILLAFLLTPVVAAIIAQISLNAAGVTELIMFMSGIALCTVGIGVLGVGTIYAKLRRPHR